jgi:hypothetical protein
MPDISGTGHFAPRTILKRGFRLTKLSHPQGGMGANRLAASSKFDIGGGP